MKHRWTIPLALLGIAALVLAAETVTVKSAEVTIRNAAKLLSGKVGVAPKGAALTVLERQGDFLKVSYEGKEGWIREKDLEPLKVGRSGGSVLASALSGSAAAGNVEESAAGKGLLQGAEEYARSIGVDPKRIDALRDRRKRIIDSGEWERFAVEGKVGAR